MTTRTFKGESDDDDLTLDVTDEESSEDGLFSDEDF